MNNYILGIDTSAYTTSLALIDTKSGLALYDIRKILTVPQGKKGLRQQEAVFQHLKNFPEMFQSITEDTGLIKTVSVSSRPRNMDGSYMPVFTVGQNYGRVIAKTLNCKYVEYSHQENHIGASLIEYYKVINDNILAIHISGGTTEFLSVKKGSKGFYSNIIGGSRDITFGQLIDRIGTAMEFPFPCGFYMEKYIATCNNNFIPLKTPAVSGNTFINLSGMENYYKNLYYSELYKKKDIIHSIFNYIAMCIKHIIDEIKDIYAFDTILITGGVASNSIIRNSIKNKIPYKIIFPTEKNSTDNALGTAYLPIIDRWYNEIKTN